MADARKNGHSPTKPTRSPQRGRPPADWRNRFLDGVRSTFNVEYACKIACVHKDTAYEHRRKDPEFKRAWDEARETGLDTLRPLLEQNNLQIAIHGEREPIFYQGEQVRTPDGELAYKTVRYPVLAMFFLERLLNSRYFVKPRDNQPPDAQQLAANVFALIQAARGSVKAPETEPAASNAPAA